MKKTLLLGISLASLVMFAADAQKPRLSKDERVKRHREFLATTGGYVVKDDPGNKAVVIVNAQQRVKDIYLKAAMSYLRSSAKINFAYKSADAAEIPTTRKALEDQNAAVMVVVEDNAASPSVILNSPDENWCRLNVAALSTDNPSEKALRHRVRVALVRAICHACGAGGSKYKTTPVMALTAGPASYDAMKAETVGLDQLGLMYDYLKSLGSRQLVRETYADACSQGWAPAPTNDVQKAIWDKVHAVPQNPIKIEFDPQKGR